MGVTAAFCVREDVEFDLSDSPFQLLRQGWMAVFKTLISLGVLCLPDLALAGSDASVIAIVCADDLYLVHADGASGQARDDGCGFRDVRVERHVGDRLGAERGIGIGEAWRWVGCAPCGWRRTHGKGERAAACDLAMTEP